MLELIGIVAALAAASAAPTDAELAEAGWSREGAWIYKQTVDPMTDKGHAAAAVFGDRGTLTVKCDEPGPGSVYVSYRPGPFLGDGRSTADRRPVLFRFDSDSPVEMLWRYSSESALLIDRPEAFTREILAGRSKVVLRATSFRFEQVTSTFPLEGAPGALRKVYGVCGDALPA